MLAILVTFIDLFVITFNFLLLVRVIMSWIPMAGSNKLGAFIHDVTEPVLLPIRKLLPQMQMIDLAPIIAFFLLRGLQILAHALLLG